MYPRFKLSARLGNVFIYDKFFPSITSAVKVASGFDFSELDCVQIYDSLLDKVFSNFFVRSLVKEIIDDKVLF